MNTNAKRIKPMFKNEWRFLLLVFTMTAKAYQLASSVMLFFKSWNVCHLKIKSADLAWKKIKSSQIGKNDLVLKSHDEKSGDRGVSLFCYQRVPPWLHSCLHHLTREQGWNAVYFNDVNQGAWSNPRKLNLLYCLVASALKTKNQRKSSQKFEISSKVNVGSYIDGKIKRRKWPLSSNRQRFISILNDIFLVPCNISD